MRRLPIPTLLVLAAAAPAADWTAADFGSQPVAIGAGPRALGMGGAFSAVADDATAVTWNPAGLTQCESPEAAASMGWYRTDLRTQDAGSPTSQSLRLDHASILWPFFAGGFQQVVGLAWQRQYDFSRNLQMGMRASDATGPFTITTDDQETISQSGSFASLGLSYAIEFRPGLSMGLSINQWGDVWTGASHYQRGSESTIRTSFSGVFPDSIQLTQTGNRSRVGSGTNVVFGAFWQASPAMTLTLVAKPAYRLRLDDTAHVRSVFDDGMGNVFTTITDTTQKTALSHPSSLTMGAAWRQADMHTVSCDLTVTRWRQYTLDDDTPQRHSPVNFAIDPSDFPDLWTLRLGYEYVAILPRVILVPRVGLLVEDLPAASKAPSLDRADEVHATHDRWFGLTAGLSLCQRQVIWDAAVQVRHGNDVGAGQFAPPDQTVDMTVTTARLGLTVQF